MIILYWDFNGTIDNPTKNEKLIRGLHTLWIPFTVKYITLKHWRSLTECKKTIEVQRTLPTHIDTMGAYVSSYIGPKL